MRRRARAAALLAALFALGACDREAPTEVGSDEVPESALRTYEVLLTGADFILSDTLVRGFGTSTQSPLLFVAENWRDTLDAHALVHLGRFPETVRRVDGDSTVTDTVSHFIDGRIVVRVDTALVAADSSFSDSTIAFELYQVAEGYDARTTTWLAREATAEDTVFWTTPGGTTAALLGTATWTRGDTIMRDSMVFTLDSASVKALGEAEDDARAIMLVTTTPGARVHVAVPRLQLSAVLDDGDTIAATSVVQSQAYVYDPPPPDPVDELRLGDRTAWRAFLVFQPGLDTLTIPCPEDPVNCSFRLGDATINRANLVLTTMHVPETYRPRVALGIEARPVLGEPDRPLERAPLADTTGVVRGIAPSRFEGGDSLVAVAVTRFVRGLLDAGGDTAVTDRNRTLALLTAPEPIGYGIASFVPAGAGDGEPVLRLIVTVAPREEDE